MKGLDNINRRQFIGLSVALGIVSILPRDVLATSMITKAIPDTGEKIPVIGMGTSRTYNARGDTELLARLAQVTQAFFDMGGRYD